MMDKAQLREILEKHQKYLHNEDGGERAYLSGADLSGAYLDGINLSGADLSGAELRGADLRVANLPSEIVEKFFPQVCPSDGSFVAWKKCGNYIVKLLIPEDALRSSAFGRKCRASKAKCIDIQNADGTYSGLTEINSDFDCKFMYCIGETAIVDDFDTDRKRECSAGIHFFITRQEAVDY